LGVGIRTHKKKEEIKQEAKGIADKKREEGWPFPVAKEWPIFEFGKKVFTQWPGAWCG
jgi:hypothetical protein